MLMLRGISRNFNLMTKLCFAFNQPPRDPTLPTESEVILPYSINFLHDNKGAVRYPKQVGRGPGSGKGKTAARGHKGQLARSGGSAHPRFEGGQTPITKRLPKYGRVFRAKEQQILNTVNLKEINYYVKIGVIDASQTITIRTLVQAGIAKDVKYGVKVLAKGLEKIDYPLNLEVSDASKSVIQKIQQAGGNIKLVHRTPLKLREHMFPEKYLIPLGEPITPWWKIRKLQRKQQDRGISIQFNKPKWIETDPMVKKEQKFVYPVPRVPNPEKIRKRKPQLFKKINYGI